MRRLGSGLACAGIFALTACSSPQTALHPVSNPQLTELRGKIDHVLDNYRPREFTLGSYIASTKGTLFQPVPATDARNAIVYLYRPNSVWNAEEVIAPSIFLNGRRLHGLRNNAYFWMELPAGEYEFAGRRPVGPVYLGFIFKTTLKVEGGKSYYFRYDEEGYRFRPDQSSGLVKVGPLSQLPEAMALKEIRETQLDRPGYSFATLAQQRWKPFNLYQTGEHPVPTERIQMQKDVSIAKKAIWWNPLTW
ncbi:MAG TPA: DUF2846 domain-containing protein [Fluviicoccus sp.]|nr:DUF2846 domain-containing protein [Fluviicoccus sp.]